MKHYGAYRTPPTSLFDFQRSRGCCWLPQTAPQLSRWTPKEIAENLGMSEKWVRQYISQKYKNQEMSSIAHQRYANRESQDDVIKESEESADEESSVPQHITKEYRGSSWSQKTQKSINLHQKAQITQKKEREVRLFRLTILFLLVQFAFCKFLS